MTLWFQIGAFTSAALLFLVQPLLARLHLAQFGGAPAVWTTAMAFFQALLLAGYAVVHFSMGRWPAVIQARWHLAVLPLALPFLPLTPAALGGSDDAAHSPTLTLLAGLARCAGVPFLLLAMTAPALQRWFAATTHPRRDDPPATDGAVGGCSPDGGPALEPPRPSAVATDPYFLYAASNAGSLLALLAYPLVVEPLLTVSQQCRLWAGGYLVFLLLMAGCALATWRHAAPLPGEPAPTRTTRSGSEPPDCPVALAASTASVTHRRRLWWTVLAFVPSSLTLAVTTTLTTDVAPIPLLWIAPLALYLLSYVVAFAPGTPTTGREMRWFYALLLPLFMTVFAFRILAPWWLLTGFHLVLLFVVSLVAHRTLVADRPPVNCLTEYYIFISLGGLIGGTANSLLAPHLLQTVTEYPLTMIVTAVVLADAAAVHPLGSTRERLQFYGVAIAITGLAMVAIRPAWELHIDDTAGVLLAGLLFYGLAEVSSRLQAVVMVALLIARLLIGSETGQVIHQSRNFFGALTVNSAASSTVHLITHGNTFHGGQDLDLRYRDIPMFYYYHEGPIGQVFAAVNRRVRPLSVAVVGLGCGAIAAYGKYGQSFTFFEIDPQVAQMARNPQLFRYLDDSRARLEVVIGDGRQGLARCATGSFDLIVIDAYNSDAIPLHLCTKEAVKLYMSRLRPDGLLAIHLSHRYLNLETVFGNIVWGLGLSGRIQNYNPRLTPPANKDEAVFASISSWAIVARDLRHFGPLAADSRWRPLRLARSSRVWTDDYTSVVSIYNWQ